MGLCSTVSATLPTQSTSIHQYSPPPKRFAGADEANEITAPRAVS